MGRRELLRWVNRTVGVEYVQVESCADGVALAQLVDAAYPDARVPLYRLDFATRHEHDRARNLEVVRATLDRLDLDVPLDVKEMSRGAYRACDEALRWLYLVVQRERPRSATRGYDGRARRLEALEKRRYLARAPSKSPGWRSAASWDDGSGGDSSLAAAASAAATAEDPDGDAPFSFSFRPRLSMDDGVAYSDGGSDGGRGLEMSVDSLDGPGEEDDPFSRAAARKETSRREKRTPLASVSVGNGKHKATTGAGAGAGAGAGPAVVRPATAPFARRRSTVSVVASARVDISPEPEPDPRRSPREEAEAEPSSGDENRSSRPRTPFVALSSLSPRPSSARLYTPRRSLDKWAEKARLKLESRERSSPRDADVPAFRASRDSEPRGRERRRAYEDASSSSSSVAADEPDAFGAFSRFTNWTTSPPGSAERAARLRREARAQALARTPRDAEARDGLNGGSGRSVEESTTRVRLARAEVAEIKAREAARRRRKEAERRARLEAEAEAEARAAEERRLEVEAEEAAQYAREVASARREVRLEEARAPRAEAQGGEGGFAAGGADSGRGAGRAGFRTGSVFVFGGGRGRRRAVSVGRGHGAGSAREETRRLGVAGGIPEVGTRGGAEAVRGGQAGHGGGRSRAGRRDPQARHRGDEAAAGGARTERELTAKGGDENAKRATDVPCRRRRIVAVADVETYVAGTFY